MNQTSFQQKHPSRNNELSEAMNYGLERKEHVEIEQNSRSYKIFNDMKNYHVKVSYNSMGEPVKNKIRIVPQYKQNCRLNNDSNIRKPPIRQKGDICYSVLDLTRTITVLREVLLGKLSRDIKYSRNWNEYTLSDILRFYCQTSFGAVKISECRQSDLFHAILALQHKSPFINTMKRLLNIPGISTLSDDIAEIFFDVWSCFLRNNILVHAKYEIELSDNITSDSNAPFMKRLLVSSDQFLQCFDSIQEQTNRVLSPCLLRNLKYGLESLNKYQSYESINYVDVDEAVDLSLRLIEQSEIRMTEVKQVLFESISQFGKILTPTGTESLSTHEGTKTGQMDYNRSFQELHFVLDQFIISDRERNGWVQYIHFRRIVKEWYERINNSEIFDHSQFKGVFELFQVDDDSIAAADYIEFVGIIYTILLEEHLIPSINDILIYFTQPRRGIESQHYQLIEEYVLQSSYIKVTSSSAKVEPKDHDINSETLHKLANIGSHSNSDFISKYLIAGSSRNGYKNLLKQSHSTKIDTTKERVKKKRTKAPLHLVEPKIVFDDRHSEIREEKKA